MRSKRRRISQPSSDAVLDAALALAREVGWESLRLRQVAARLDMPLAALRRVYRDQDALADAWFGRLEAAMLGPYPDGFADLPEAERAAQAMERWFALAGTERRITLDMLRAKLYPSHLHHWVPLVFNLSRLIQWLREAARLDAGGRRRQVEEIGLTSLFLAALFVWRGEAGADAARTRRIIRAGTARLFRRLG
jgi:AcrR family transcriptional regulator